MPGEHMERIMLRPLMPSKFAEPSAVSTASCHYSQMEDAGPMGSEISESGWTMYFDQSLDSWTNKNAPSQFDNEKQQKKKSQYTENDAERYPTYDYQASSITGNEEDSSMASDASSGPQKLPLPLLLPVQDIQFEQERQAAESYSRKRGVHGKHEDLECIASCSSMDVHSTRNKLRKVNKNGDNNGLPLWLQDTASSHIHRPESGVLECEVNIEPNLQLSVGDIEVQEVSSNMRFEIVQSLLQDRAKERASSIVPDTNFPYYRHVTDC